jgi:TonB family protein
MLRSLLLVCLFLPAIAVAQASPRIITVTPAGETPPVEKKDITPDVSACQFPDNQKFTAQISVTVSLSGRSDQITLLYGTGYKCLDDAALTAVKAASWTPATQNGMAVTRSIVRHIDMARYDKDHPQPIKLSSRTVPPMVFFAPEPDRRSCHPGKDAEHNVLVRVIIGTNGKPQNEEIARTSGDKCLDDAALKAAREYRFRPATLDGHPVNFPMNLEMQLTQP